MNERRFPTAALRIALIAPLLAVPQAAQDECAGPSCAPEASPRTLLSLSRSGGNLPAGLTRGLMIGADSPEALFESHDGKQIFLRKSPQQQCCDHECKAGGSSPENTWTEMPKGISTWVQGRGDGNVEHRVFRVKGGDSGLHEVHFGQDDECEEKEVEVKVKVVGPDGEWKMHRSGGDDHAGSAEHDVRKFIFDTGDGEGRKEIRKRVILRDPDLHFGDLKLPGKNLKTWTTKGGDEVFQFKAVMVGPDGKKKVFETQDPHEAHAFQLHELHGDAAHGDHGDAHDAHQNVRLHKLEDLMIGADGEHKIRVEVHGDKGHGQPHVQVFRPKKRQQVIEVEVEVEEDVECEPRTLRWRNADGDVSMNVMRFGPHGDDEAEVHFKTIVVGPDGEVHGGSQEGGNTIHLDTDHGSHGNATFEWGAEAPQELGHHFNTNVDMKSLHEHLQQAIGGEGDFSFGFVAPDVNVELDMEDLHEHLQNAIGGNGEFTFGFTAPDVDIEKLHQHLGDGASAQSFTIDLAVPGHEGLQLHRHDEESDGDGSSLFGLPQAGRNVLFFSDDDEAGGKAKRVLPDFESMELEEIIEWAEKMNKAPAAKRNVLIPSPSKKEAPGASKASQKIVIV